jgi:hypothetical protein
MSAATPTPSSPLAVHAPAAAAGVALALAVLLVATRGQHAASIDALPSASWAVFFLAGALLRPRLAFVGFLALATLVDVGSLAADRIAAHCMGAAYWTLVPAYAALWFGGRVYARLHRDAPATVPRLAAVLLASAVAAYVFAKGGYYALSGAYPDGTLGGFLARVPTYFPPAIAALAGYAALGTGLRVALRGRAADAAARHAARA